MRSILISSILLYTYTPSTNCMWEKVKNTFPQKFLAYQDLRYKKMVEENVLHARKYWKLAYFSCKPTISNKKSKK